MTSIGTLFRPPAIRSATLGVLDRSLFSKTINLAAAAISDRKQISRWRKELHHERSILIADRLSAIVPHPDAALASQVPETWTELLRQAATKGELGVIPYALKLDYDYWTYDDVMRALLPSDVRMNFDGIQCGFNMAGHVAHMNLRESFLPYKKLMAEVLIDKNPGVKTVINKIDNVGNESEFRTFAFEVLAGPNDLEVQVRENECVFNFDYGKVYWNSKLDGEHERIAKLIRPGEVLCDVMAGIGPFAIPAGKRGVLVWANDYNPESYRYMKENIARNKVKEFVRPFNEDGRTFIRKAADSVYAASTSGEHAVIEMNRKDRRRLHHQNSTAESEKGEVTPPEPKRIPIPPTISHFVMNLPASAITFLPHFRGVYAGHEQLFAPHTGTKLPMVHVHCFAAKADDDGPHHDVCGRVAAELGIAMKLGDPEMPGEVEVREVRAVAPNKCMFCATFRLPAEVAFAPRP
ncbi:Met-10+ like-protein-domain-containing protein [Xylariomycetidae sp. FL0641]|nr:Met-10+ like-protein-domain-containing protein [Xylariomycetidae sp. FL0641]